MIHQHHLLALGAQQMEAGQGADHMVVLVQDGIGAVAAFQQHLAHVVQIIVQMEGDDLPLLADAIHGQGLIDDAGDAAGAERGGDDDGVAADLGPRGLHIGAAEDDGADLGFNGVVHQLRLVAADQDRVRVGEGLILVILGKRDKKFTGNDIPRHLVFVDQAALQHAQQVKEGQIVDAVLVHGLDIVGGDIAGGEHAAEQTIVIHNGNDVQMILLQGAQGQIHGDGAVEGRGTVVIQIPHLGAHVFDQRRRLEPEAVQQLLGLVVDGADAHRAVVAIPHGVAQVSIGDGGDDGVGIRVAMPGHIDIGQRKTSFASNPLNYAPII